MAAIRNTRIKLIKGFPPGFQHLAAGFYGSNFRLAPPFRWVTDDNIAAL
jgi:hypothetical protein